VLSQPRPSPFLTPAFLLPWARRFAGPVKAGCWREEALVLLHRTSQGWELLGGQDVADRLDLLGDGPEFWENLRRECGACSFPNLAPDAWVLQSQRPGDALEVTDQSPYVPLEGSFDTYLARLGKKDRHELQRKMRRAERLCQHELRLTAGSQDLEVFLHLHRLSSPRKAMFMQADMEDFFRDLCHSLEQADMLHLTTLWDGDIPLASQFQLRFNNVLHLYNSGYDPAQSALAPGMVLLGMNIRAACESGIHEYDLLRGTERYKYDVGGIDRPVYRLQWTAA
jgi:hypothetical protein